MLTFFEKQMIDKISGVCRDVIVSTL